MRDRPPQQVVLYRLFAFAIDWCPIRDCNARLIICRRDAQQYRDKSSVAQPVARINILAIVFHHKKMELFIESVRKYPELYDISHVQYKNVLIKDAKWKEIFDLKIRNQLVSFFQA
jgi:hypothetical protein